MSAEDDRANDIRARMREPRPEPHPLSQKLALATRRLEEIIGARMLARRTELHLTQEQVGERVGRRLGREWTRQAVSAAEKGRRAFTAVELIAIANVLGETIVGLLTPPDDVDLVVLGELDGRGGGITPDELSWALLAAPVAGEAYWEIQNAFLRFGQHAQLLGEVFILLGDDLEAINKAASSATKDGTEAGGDHEPAEG